MNPVLGPGLLLALCTSTFAPVADWTQPPIRTGVERVEALPWARTVEEALVRAKQEKKLVLATVVAVSGDHWVSGYAGADAHWKKLKPPYFGDEVGLANDDGLRKERVMMAAWFAEPEFAALVAQHFVPVRVRCRPWDFDLDFPTDPLSSLGTKLDEVGGPALVVAKADGTFVHALGRIGVFDRAIGGETLRAALAKAGVKNVAPPPTEPRPPIAADVVTYAEQHGVRLDEWTRGASVRLEKGARTTELDASKQTVDALLARAADVLLALQSESGGWRDPCFDVRATGGAGTEFDREVPRTALVVDALLALRARLPDRKVELEAAAQRGIEVVARFADAPKPWIWQATYALHAQIVLMRSDFADSKAKARERAERLVKTLVGMQQDGGWSYMPAPRTHSFNTAIVLLLFAELGELGVEVPEESLTAARKFLASVRNPSEARDYWYAPAMTFEPRASSCRTALCELALVAAGDTTAARRLDPALAFFFELEPGARSVTKIYEAYLSPNALQDAYHYYFGHYYAARALAHVPKSKAAAHAQRQVALLKRQAEADGSFVDAQAQGKSYSTAMAVLTLIEDLRWTKP